ncbi:MAG: FAD-binding protein, partial [Phenylobacterium sp.]
MALSYHSQLVEPWGRTPRLAHQVARPQHRDQLPGLIAEASGSGGLLAAGLHRSYGDSGLNPDGLMISMRGLDRFIAFDPATGVLRAEAGVSLDEILRTVTPHGWFL